MSSQRAARTLRSSAWLGWARVPSLALLGLALLGWGAWLSFPSEASLAERKPGLTAMLIDVSGSATRRRTGWEVRARQAALEVAREAQSRGDEFVLVTYAADVQRLTGPAPAEEAIRALRGENSAAALRFAIAPERELGSRLASALEVVAPALLESARGPSRLIVRGDESFTGRDPAPELAALLARGIQLESAPLEPCDQPDIALLEFEVPAELELGTIATARVEIESSDAARVGAVLELELEVGGQFEKREVELESRATRSTHFVDLGLVREGTTRIAARVSLAQSELRNGDDRIPENDSARAEFRSRGSRKCVVVSRDIANAQAWIGSVPSSLDLRFVQPEAFGSELGDADFCITVDVQLGEMDGVLLREFVLRGGGLLVSGGWNLLSDWTSESARSVAELLPLSLAEEQRPPRDVEFIIDGSGSMSGDPFQAVREAVIDLVPSAPVSDRVSLRFFTGALQPKVVLASGENADPVERRIRAQTLLAETVPGGQTELIASLEALSKERADSNRAALILLLTDGHETNTFKIGERAARLVQEFAATQTTLEIVAVGEEPNLELLGLLLPEDREPIRVLDFQGLDEVFQEQVNRERVEEGPLALGLASLPREEFAADLADALRAVAIPPLARALRTQPTDSAKVLAGSVSGNPLLAVQRVGLGETAVFATGPGANWSGALRLGTHLEPLLVSLSRNAGSERAPRLVLAEELRLENAPLNWPAQLEVRFSRETGSESERLGECRLEFAANSLSVDPRSQRSAARPAFLELLAAGTPLTVDLVNLQGERLTRLALAAAAPPEFAHSKSVRMPRNGAAREPSSAPSGRPHPLAVWLVAAGLACLAAAALPFRMRA